MNKKSSKPGRCFSRTTLSLFLCNALMFSQSAALADCQPDSFTDENPPADPDDWLPQEGDTVTCTGNDADGFARGGINQLTVNVNSGATVASPGILLSNSNGSKIINNGTIFGMSISGIGVQAINNGTTGGIGASGTNSLLENYGLVDGSAWGNGPNAVVKNYGTVTETLEVRGADGELTNHAGAIADALFAFEGNGTNLTNYGQVTSGILMEGTGFTIINNNQVSTTADFLPSAISGQGSGEITNAGVVTATSTGSGMTNQHGITSYAYDSMTITNSGTVESDGIGIGIEFDIFATPGSTGVITNNGSVTTHLDYAPALGLKGSGSITNDQTGFILTEGEESEGIGAIGNNVDITNKNMIHTLGLYSSGIYKEGDGGIVRNDGTIETELGGAPGVYIIGNNTPGNSTIINSGNIITDGYLSPGIAVNGYGHYIQLTEGSTIATSGDDADGIKANNIDKIENAGQITSNGFLSDGIEAAGPELVIENLGTGSITANGAAATGINSIGEYAEITNLGSITTTGDALWGIYVEGDDATVTNDGGWINTISSGIYVVGNNATVSNIFASDGGLISTSAAEAPGILVEGTDATVHNYMNIETSGLDSHGIKAIGNRAMVHNHAGGVITTQNGSAIFASGAPVSSIQNDGLLLSGTTGSTNSDGIHVISQGPDNTIISNTGIIESHGNDSDGISVTAAGDTEITSSGFITTQGDYANGIELSGVAGHTVTNSGQLTSTGSQAHGIALFRIAAGGENTITNEGSVTAAGTGTSAIFLSTFSGDTTFIVNRDTGTLAGSEYAIEGGAGDEIVSNFGSIIGDVELGGGNDIFRRKSNSTVQGIVNGGSQPELDLLDVSFNGDEELDGAQFTGFELLAINGTGSISMISDHTTNNTAVLSGTLTIDEGVTLFSDSTTVSTGGTLNGNGTVSGMVEANGGEIDIGESIGALEIGGDLLINSGMLSFEADSPTSRDQLTVGGNVTFTDAIVQVFLGYTPESDEVLDFMTVSGGVDITSGFDIIGIAQAGSGVALGTEFNVNLGGQLFEGIVTSAVPVPASAWLFGSGMIVLVRLARRRVNYPSR